MEDPEAPFYVNLPSANIKFTYDGNPRGYFSTGNQITHKTNSTGFRGNEFSYDKPSRVFRIAFLGDSFTFGEGVKFDETYPEKTAQLLNQKCGTRDRLFESYNFGVSSYNTAQELFLLKKVVLKTQPDMMVLGYALNDAEPGLFRVNLSTGVWKRQPREQYITEGMPDKKPPQNLWFKSRTAQWVWKILLKIRMTAKTENYYKGLYRPGNPGWETTKTSLQELIRVCENSRIHCFIVCFPLLHSLNSDYPFKEIHALIRREIRPEKHPYIHFIDLFDYLKGKNAGDLWVHPTDPHPNEIVQTVAAEALVNEISKIRPWDRRAPALPASRDPKTPS